MSDYFVKGCRMMLRVIHQKYLYKINVVKAPSKDLYNGSGHDEIDEWRLLDKFKYE